MNDRGLVIWGAGNYGRAAQAYYKEKYNDILFVDTNPQKWGTMIDGVPICDPDTMDFIGKDIVIATKHFHTDIIHKLQSMNVNQITVFGIVEEKKELSPSDCKLLNVQSNNVLILHFSGGLGNQLFQYAFYKNALLKHDCVYANIENCNKAGTREFVLGEAFPQISLNVIDGLTEKEIIKKVYERRYGGKFLISNEKLSWGREVSSDKTILDVDGGVYYGLFQSNYWPANVRQELLSDLVFNENKEKALLKYIQDIEECTNAVSIHFRRGDYLQERNRFSYGNICTEKYYQQAINYMRNNVDEPRFYVFSDEIDYVRQNYHIPNAVYIENNLFDEYEDWYDMCLMSKCRHNIIANSTFSWWGAWLNKNENKIVIAPKKWINSYNNREIYPKEWIKIE